MHVDHVRSGLCRDDRIELLLIRVLRRARRQTYVADHDDVLLERHAPAVDELRIAQVDRLERQAVLAERLSGDVGEGQAPQPRGRRGEAAHVIADGSDETRWNHSEPPPSPYLTG